MKDSITVVILDEDNEVIETQTISFNDMEFDAVHSDERGMGAEITYELRYETDKFSIVNTIWEYPQGSFNHQDGWKVENGNVQIESDNIDYQNLFTEVDDDF